MARRKKERAASDLTVQEFAAILLYDEVKDAIVWVLKDRGSVKKKSLARYVVKDYFRVLNLSGAAMKAAEQSVMTCAGRLARTGITYRETSDSYVYGRGA